MEFNLEKKFYIYIFYCFIYIISYVKAKEYSINITNDDINNLDYIINQKQQTNKDLVLYFNEKEYDFSTSSGLNINIRTNVTFINTKRTKITFNFGNKNQNNIRINFFEKTGILKIINIKFQNFKPNDPNVYLLKSSASNDNYQLIFEKCAFENISNNIFKSQYRCSKVTQNEPQVIFNNCRFTKINHRILSTLNEIDNSEEETSLCNKINFENCNFNNNNDLMLIHRGTININNCHFTNTSSSTGESAAFIESRTINNQIIISNTIFESSEVTHNVPYMHFIGTSVTIKNTTFSGCHTDNGYLIKIDKCFDNNKITIDNSKFDDVSTIFYGNYNTIDFKNSEIKNIHLKNSIPLFNNNKNTLINIINSSFRNLSTIGSSLLGSEATYNCSDVEFANVSTNAKAIIHLLYNSHSFNNVLAKNISNYGDISDASFIYFDSGEVMQILNLNNVNIINGKSNGPFIRISGDSNIINIKNSNFNKINSYGSIIKNYSKKSKVVIQNLTFDENKNLDKTECGTIHFENDLELSISDSSFSRNLSKNYGGAICLTNNNNLTLSIKSSQYISNTAERGGAIYFDSYIHNNNNNNNNNSSQCSISIKNVIFSENKVTNFGGAIYSNNEKLYQAEIKDLKFSNNLAKIAGGAIYVPNNRDKKSLDISNCIFSNNVGEAYGNDYTTEVSYIKRNTNNDPYKMKIGEYVQLKFLLYDEFNMKIEDKYNIYSNISIKVLLLDNFNKTDNSNSNSNIILKGNICSFYKGVCDLSQMKLYAIPGNYTLLINVENHYNSKKFKIDNVIVNMRDCDQNQYKITKDNNIVICEDPVCDRCFNGICTPPENHTINSVELNTCTCSDGYKGLYCDEKILIDLNKIVKDSIYPTGIAMLLVLLSIVFLIYNRNKRVIQETGFTRHIIYSLGVLLIYSSSFFLGYDNYLKCVINFILYHHGVILIYCILIIHIQINLAMGVNPKKKNKEESTEELDEVSVLPYNNASNNDANNSNSTMDILENTNNMSLRKLHLTIHTKNVNKLFKKIKTVNNLYSKIYLYYIFFVIIITVLITIKKLKENKKLVFDLSNKKFKYECPLDEYNNALSFIEFVFFIPLTIRQKKVWSYECIFKIVKYINYSILIWIATGPFLYFIANVVFQDNIKSKILLLTNGNFLCYTILYFLYMYNIIKTIIIRKSENPQYFFKYPSPNFCFEHKIYDCDCDRDMNEVIVENQINGYLLDYKYCLNLFDISNGKVHIISHIKKIKNKSNKKAFKF
ncbi:hypothetical protein BCR32DRAFT_269275 [Anaeromyces robustus]|uniref:EGF-like domain-containing protein n=1 Tax=Anaeromyces robustus TaxID=1754192 RepID=A0A1Y1X292_9FUNG|nr:hypothetical protein BCR32DRAFT_269275 [Anaeromyces robustus]|eukprot:ORX79748.1 hypothetical protein BCR32DRAFT_269275 [Anaeromyces robustus]